MNGQNTPTNKPKTPVAQESEVLFRRDLTDKPVTAWHVFSVVLLVLIGIWHVVTCIGWFTGETLVSLYGLNEFFAEACTISPEMLLYVPYFCVAVHVASILFILYILYGFLAEGTLPTFQVTIAYGTAGVAALALPLGHIVADMFVFAAKIRGTMSFDIGDLGMNITNMCVITVVSVLLVLFNIKWCNLQAIED